VHTGRRWYLAAWDKDRQDWRTFRVDRMESPLRTAGRFTPREPPEGDFAAYVSKSVVYPNYLYRAKVLLHAAIGAAAERLPLGAGTLEAIGEHLCVLNTGASSLDSLSVYLALIGFDFEVKEPPELVDRVRCLAERFRRAAL
jgi:predicted DNA-binding transcriptional regulator YafY